MLKPQAEQHQDSRKTPRGWRVGARQASMVCQWQGQCEGICPQTCTPLGFRKHSWEKPIGVLASCKFPPQRHSALVQVDRSQYMRDVILLIPKKQKDWDSYVFSKETCTPCFACCLLVPPFATKKQVPEDVFRWTFPLQALTDFKPSELKGAEEVESSRRLKGVFW